MSKESLQFSFHSFLLGMLFMSFPWQYTVLFLSQEINKRLHTYVSGSLNIEEGKKNL